MNGGYKSIIGRSGAKENRPTSYSANAKIYVGLMYGPLSMFSDNMDMPSDQSLIKTLNERMAFGHICYDNVRGTSGSVVPTDHATVLISSKGYKNRFLRNHEKSKFNGDVSKVNVPFEYSIRLVEDKFARPSLFTCINVAQPKSSINLTNYYRQMPPVEIEWFNASTPKPFYEKYPEFFVPSESQLASEPGRAAEIRARNIRALMAGTFRNIAVPNSSKVPDRKFSSV